MRKERSEEEKVRVVKRQRVERKTGARMKERQEMKRMMKREEFPGDIFWI